MKTLKQKFNNLCNYIDVIRDEDDIRDNYYSLKSVAKQMDALLEECAKALSFLKKQEIGIHIVNDKYDVDYMISVLNNKLKRAGY